MEWMARYIAEHNSMPGVCEGWQAATERAAEICDALRAEQDQCAALASERGDYYSRHAHEDSSRDFAKAAHLIRSRAPDPDHCPSCGATLPTLRWREDGVHWIVPVKGAERCGDPYHDARKENA